MQYNNIHKQNNTTPTIRGGGICITFSELGHKRWKRLDYVRRMYNIHTYEDFTINNLLKEVENIALKNKKQIKVYKICEWPNIARVYLQVFNKKITEQWDKNKTYNKLIINNFEYIQELKEIANENNTTTNQLIQDILTDFIINTPK